MQRFIEIWSSIPVLYLLIILAAILPPGFFILLGIMLLFSWMSLVGVVRAEFLRGTQFRICAAPPARSACGNRTIMFRHLLPNAMVATLTFLPFILTGSITTLTSLDFLGFGLPPGSPSLGELLAQGKHNLHAPWLGLTAFIMMAIMLSLLIFIGEAVRDAFDPRKTFRMSARPFSPSATSRSPSARAAQDERWPSTTSPSTSRKGETLALVGESGSGKSVIGPVDPASSCPIRRPATPRAEIMFDGQDLLNG
ncbi:MAG: ABC transporter permease subunit [Stutzerimonas stutzeri]